MADFYCLHLFIQLEIWFFLVGSASLVFYLIIKGKINTKGILIGKESQRANSWEKTQVLLISLFFVIYYLYEVRTNLDSGRLPDIPIGVVWLLGSSNLIYVYSQAKSLLNK